MDRAMRRIAVCFAVFGAFWGSWAVAAFDVQQFLEFSDGQLGLLLAATVGVGALANMFGGTAAERWGTRPVLAAALGVWGLTLAVGAALHQPLAFCVMFTLLVATGGMVDVVMNVAAVAGIGAEPWRLLRFHALFNAGNVIGAALTGVADAVDLSWRWVWLAIAVGAAVLALTIGRIDLPAGGRGEHHTVRAGLGAIVRAGLVPLAIVFAAGAIVEGGVGTWGVLFLRDHLEVAALAGAAAYMAGQVLATGARATLGWSVRRIGEARGARLGLGLAAAGLIAEAASDSPVIAGAGLAAAAVGSAVYWPLLLAHAAAGAERPGVVVGGITAAGYIGFLAGPPLVGVVADLGGLRAGLVVLAVVAALGAVFPLRTTSPDAATGGMRSTARAERTL